MNHTNDRGHRQCVGVWLDDATVKAMDERARLLGLTRSRYVETLVKAECGAVVEFVACPHCKAPLLGGDGHGPRRGT